MDGVGTDVPQPPVLKTEVVDRPLEGGVGHEGEVGCGVDEVFAETSSEGGEEDLVADLEP